MLVAVAVGVGQEDDLAVAEPRGVVLAVDPAAEGADEVRQLLVLQQLLPAGLLDVEDLPPQRQDRLSVAIPPLLRRPPGRVALDDEQLGLLRAVAVAVGEFPRQV